jgi:hypothetical protein
VLCGGVSQRDSKQTKKAIFTENISVLLLGMSRAVANKSDLLLKISTGRVIV